MPTTINLSKPDSSIPWGFRLHGGKDFGSPLTVQRINPGSIAAKCGLLIGDNISAIDSVQTSGLKHKDAQDLIMKAGNNIQITICRGDEIPIRNVDHSVGQITFEQTFKTADNEPLSSQIYSLNISESTNKPTSSVFLAKSATPYKPMQSNQSISSNNSSLYHPSMQTITSGLTKNHQFQDTDHGNEDFPMPPPPPLPTAAPPFTPTYSSQPSKPHQPVQCFPDITIIDGSPSKPINNDGSASKYIPSETYKLVKDIESGLEVPFNPKTGAGVRSSPIQSRLVDILEKKHATFEQGATTGTPYTGPKSLTSSYAISNAINNNRSISPARKMGNNKTSPLGINNSSSSYMGSGVDKTPTSSPFTPSTQKASSDVLDPDKIPICNVCNSPVRGAYILAVNKIWCPDHFLCSNPNCRKPLSDIGFVEEEGQLYCKDDYERFLAPRCNKCQKPIVGNTVKALKATFHPDCFTCKQCNQPIMGGSFHLHEGEVYCDRDFSALFSTKCVGCNFTIEVGENWIEAAGTNWHGECFNCQVCKVNLQNIGFVHKNGKFLCRDHAKTA